MMAAAMQDVSLKKRRAEGVQALDPLVLSPKLDARLQGVESRLEERLLWERERASRLQMRHSELSMDHALQQQSPSPSLRAKIPARASHVELL